MKQPHVLVVEQDPGERAGLAKQLSLSGFAVVGQAGFGVEAVTMATDSQPDLIVIGIEEPVARGLHTLDTLALRAPQAVKVVISTLQEPAYLRKAMLSGASEYLDRNLAPDALATALVVALERDSRRRELTDDIGDATHKGSIVTIMGPKGGIGKTTIATNLAAAIASHCEERVAIVDLDTMFGDVAVLLDIQASVTIMDLVRDLQTVDRTSIQQYLVRHDSGALVLAGPRRPAEWGGVTPDQMGRILTLLADVFDTVIVDSPGSFSENVARALDLSNLVLLVTSPDAASTKDAMIALELMRNWEFDSDKLKLVVNFPNATSVMRERHVGDALQYPVFWSIPNDRRLQQYRDEGLAITIASPQSPAAKSIIDLAFAITGARRTTKSPAIKAPAASKGGGLSPFKRLFGFS